MPDQNQKHPLGLYIFIVLIIVFIVYLFYSLVLR